VRRFRETLLNLLYPSTCSGCGQPTERPEFCHPCRKRIATPASPLCPTCGVPFRTRDDADHPCARCLQHPPHFGRARACTIYDAADSSEHPLKAALQQYKYNRDVWLAGPLGALLAERTPLAVGTYDIMIPVPLHVQRLRWRGFNQAQLLARPLAQAAGVRLDPYSLERVRPTRPQVELDENERRRNVGGAFCVVQPKAVAGRRILLVDDVYTTGATVDECSRVLLRAGAQSVDVLALARAVLH
jgi:ComF family protein